MEDSVNTCRIYCNLCEQVTNHTLAFSHAYDRRQSEEQSSDFYGQYRLWFCAGCEACTMEDFYTCDFMYAQVADGELSQEYNSIYYPKPEVGFRSKKQFQKLSPKLAKLYDEVILAHNNNLLILCSAGLRGLIEGYSLTRTSPVETLKRK